MVAIGKGPLSLEDVKRVAIGGEKAQLSPAGVKRIQAARDYLHSEIKRGKTIYGVNTGFGLLSNVRVSDKEIRELQTNLLRSHAAGAGPAMPEKFVRAMLLLRAHTLAQGHSGVSVELVQQILKVLNKRISPVVPQQGSVGACGDLAPLAHLALVLIGEGRAHVRGKEMSGAQALRQAGLKPIRLGMKEGLALTNGTQFMTGIGTLALLEAEHLADAADAAGAMTLDALRGTPSAFDPLIHKIRPHAGQIEVAKRMRKLLSESGRRSEIGRSHLNCDRVQDPYSLRCIPQVHGASRDMLSKVREVLETEVNAVTDNPLVFAESKKILSGGNFHGQAVSMAMDMLSIAASEFASISEQRLAKLVNPALSGLPAFLAPKGGLNSGFMIVHVAAASIVSENKALCHPASIDSIPTSADKEDHVSMGAWSARKAMRVVTNTRRVLAMELLGAAQGIDLLRPLKTTSQLERIYRRVRRGAKMAKTDQPFYKDIQFVESLLEKGELESLVKVQ